MGACDWFSFRTPAFISTSRLVLPSDQREGRSRSAERVEAQPSKLRFVRNAFRPNMRTTGTGKDFAMQLPERPNLRHLRDQAKDLVRTGATPTLAAAQFQTARQYGFPSWPKLKQHVESLEQAGELRQAIRRHDLARMEALLIANPSLRKVLIDDVPLQALAQPGCIPIMELLVRYGADVNGLCWGWFPVLFTPCENLQPEPLQWLLDHGADPNRGNPRDPGTALDYVIQTDPRNTE